jgi:hypothetical protein
LADVTKRKFAAIEVGGVSGFIGYHTTLDVPSEKIEDDEKTIYTSYTPLGVCGGNHNLNI